MSTHGMNHDWSQQKECLATSILLCSAVICDIGLNCGGAPFFLTFLHIMCVFTRPLHISFIAVALCGGIFDAHMTSHFGFTSVYAIAIALVMEPFMTFVRKRPTFLWLWASYGVCACGYVIASHSITYGMTYIPQIATPWALSSYGTTVLSIMGYPLFFYLAQRIDGITHHAR